MDIKEERERCRPLSASSLPWQERTWGYHGVPVEARTKQCFREDIRRKGSVESTGDLAIMEERLKVVFCARDESGALNWQRREW